MTMSILQSQYVQINLTTNEIILLVGVFLLSVVFILKKLHAFRIPPAVKKKRLPRRPALQIVFKPDNISLSMNHSSHRNTGEFRNRRSNNVDDGKTNWRGGSSTMTPENNVDDDISSIDDHDDFMTTSGHSTTNKTYASANTNTKKATPFMSPHDLPDSFAPLLSSSQMELITDELTSDLLHATHMECSVRLRRGRHEIPLDKDPSRPQFVLDVPLSSGCKMTAAASIGSDGFSKIDDMDVSKPTNERSLPLVKHAGIVLDPPLPLVNVAPTLIHFPTLFEDNIIKYTWRRITIVKYILDFINSASSFIENVLWIVESKCQIHLRKVSVTPLYKGESKQRQKKEKCELSKENSSNNKNNTDPNFVERRNDSSFMEPQWRLSLSFSGHVLLFGWIPIPFVDVTLPTWIIPQPHALLEKLLTNQPLASAKVRRELISEKQITLAVLDAVEAWDLKLEAVATPPALSADLVLPGGISVAVETMHGTDVSGGRVRDRPMQNAGLGNMTSDVNSLESMSSCTMYTDSQQHKWFQKRRRMKKSSVLKQTSFKGKQSFDANDLVPWKLEVVVNGRIDRDKISMSLSKFVASHDPFGADIDDYGMSRKSNFSLSGHLMLCRPDTETILQSPSRKRLSAGHLSLNGEYPKLQSEDISVASILLFTEKKSYSCSSSKMNNLLHYDYAFDIGEDTSLDAMSLSIGASHPMLKGGTIITTILENFYASGTIGARPNSVIDMSQRSRKRYILRHLPAVGLTAGIQNFFIPDESFSYSDDGQTKCIPELSGGQLMIRVTGGYANNSLLSSRKNLSSSSLASTRNSRDNSRSSKTGVQDLTNMTEGIKVVVDFGIASLVLNNESKSFEFPELDIFDDQKLQSLLNGSIDGSIKFHLRPQDYKKTDGIFKTNLFNPLECFEIEFSGSKVFLKIVESNATLGHRRIIIPSETTMGVTIAESIVDMSLEGSTRAQCFFDFQGSSPILQVGRNIGVSPKFVCHEERQQVPILINSLRQGRFNLNVSSVGGLTVTEAATSRDHREGLYDWKFFNAIVSPDEHSFDHMTQVIHDKRTMLKVLQVVKLINSDVEKFLSYVLRQVWRAKDIFDDEGVSDPAELIPSYKMARLISLFLCGNVDQVKDILPIVQRAVAGDGIDTIALKELLRKNLPLYDNWAPEIDRAVKWVEVLLGSQEAPKAFVENNVSPLSLSPKYQSQFADILSARELYTTLLQKKHLPLDIGFSGLVSSIAPYLSFRQIEYILQVRSPEDWQATDIRRLRYVYSIKKKVLDISESYGGLSFMPQSFFVSTFLGEATRASLRARSNTCVEESPFISPSIEQNRNSSYTTLQNLRQRRNKMTLSPNDMYPDHMSTSQASRRTRNSTFKSNTEGRSKLGSTYDDFEEAFTVGDSLLGPQDVAILLQAGLTSSMKGSTVVQLNQRMLLDVMASQPRLFAVAVLSEIGSPGGEGNPRGLTSALMALLDLDQSSFHEFHRLDIHQLLESWLPGLSMPRRDDYLAGGRWASQSFYSAIFRVANSILEEAESYIAFKHHVQRVRVNQESDPVPTVKESDEVSKSEQNSPVQIDVPPFQNESKLSAAIELAKTKIKEADDEGQKVYKSLKERKVSAKNCKACEKAILKYEEAFAACRELLQLQKLSFHLKFFKDFYRRNYDALMVKSVFDNLMNDDDNVREWLGKMRKSQKCQGQVSNPPFPSWIPFLPSDNGNKGENSKKKLYFDKPTEMHEQEIIDEIIDLLFLDEKEREIIGNDPLTRLLLSNPPGKYNFTIVSAMGVITEGKKGLELETAFLRLKELRGVGVIRSDTGTARSFEYNSSKIEDAIESAVKLEKPYGLLGYSQGCANGLFCESLLRCGTPSQQSRLRYLVCRQLLFSAANGSLHGPAMEAKIHRLIVMCEQFFKYQQGYFSRAFTKTVLESLTDIMDSAAFQKFVAGGGGTFLHSGSRAFWREAQHLPHVPTCVMRGVLEEHTTPESLQMISNFLSKHAGSPLHDSQVHVCDAVGRPIYTHNRNSKVLKQCDMGGAIQRTHHWSPLSDEVKFLETQQDKERGTFLCAKDRHIFPWCDVNARFGFIKYISKEEDIPSHE